MFFPVSKILGGLCLPFTQVLLLLAAFAFLVRRRPRAAWVCFWIALVGMYALSTRPVADLITRPLEEQYPRAALPASIDAIVVLGGATDLGTSLPERLEFGSAADRFIEGVILARQYPDAVLVFSGGTSSLFDASRLEAPWLAEYAEKLGIPRTQIRAEERSRNTRENATETAAILRAEGRTSLLLVTSAFHMPRSVGCFHQAGLYPIPYPVDFRTQAAPYDVMSLLPNINNLADASHSIREYWGLLVYSLKGYI
ncbi:MAG: YdcF family protein [Armatimonadetes bacterium]|jgi:uncharacterized SAM-binding protein YcdF (DUF218 family)|nr:YdcF family protein [Armatimonadota bacterium]